MNAVYCECCGEMEDACFNPLKPVQINDDAFERSYMLCRTCREKLRRLLEGHGL